MKLNHLFCRIAEVVVLLRIFLNFMPSAMAFQAEVWSHYTKEKKAEGEYKTVMNPVAQQDHHPSRNEYFFLKAALNFSFFCVPR